MDLDEDVWVGRLITTTLDDIVRELEAEQEPDGVARSSRIESVILANLHTGIRKSGHDKGHVAKRKKKKIKEKAIGVTTEFKEYTQGRPFKASILPEVRENSAAARKVASFRTGVREHIRSLAACVSRKTVLKDAEKRDGDVENAGSLSLVVYSSTGPADSRRTSPDTDVLTSKKRGRFSRFRALLSRLCCCR